MEAGGGLICRYLPTRYTLWFFAFVFFLAKEALGASQNFDLPNSYTLQKIILGYFGSCRHSSYFFKTPHYRFRFVFFDLIFFDCVSGCVYADLVFFVAQD